MSVEVYNTLGELKNKAIKRDSSNSSCFRIIHTSSTTIIISEGLSTDAFPIEFYVEIDGHYSRKELKHHFLVFFLDKTIEEALQEDELKEKLAKGMHAFTFQISFFSDINDYFIKEQEDNMIGALAGINSVAVPPSITINDREVNLVNVRPFSNDWVKKLNEVDEFGTLFPQMLKQFKLTYKNYLSPFKDYSEDSKAKKVSYSEKKKIDRKLDNLYDKGEHEDTLAYINELIEDNIEYYNLLFTKAQTLSFLGRREESKEEYRKVIALYPKESEPYLNIATQLKILKENEEAIKMYSHVIEEFTGDNVNKAYYDRGMLYAKLDLFDQAISDVGMSPYSFGNRQIAKFFICNHDFEGAIEFMNDTINKEYENFKARFHFYLMICYYLTDKHEEAEQSYQEFLRTKKKNAKEEGRLDEIIRCLNKGDEFRTMLEEKGGQFFTYDKPDWVK